MVVGRAALHVEDGAQVPEEPLAPVERPSKGFSSEDTTLEAPSKVGIVSLTRENVEKRILNFSAGRPLNREEFEFRQRYRDLYLPSLRTHTHEQAELLHVLSQDNIADDTQRDQIILDLRRLFPSKSPEVEAMISQIFSKANRLKTLFERDPDEKPAGWTRAKIEVPKHRARIEVPLPPEQTQSEVPKSAEPPQSPPEWSQPAKFQNLNSVDLYKYLKDLPGDEEVAKGLSKMSPRDTFSLEQNLEKLHDEKLPPGWFKGIRRWWSSVGKPGELYKAIENQKRILGLITGSPIDQDKLQSALDEGQVPRQTTTGTTESFFVAVAGKITAGVFKAMRSEPGGELNTRMATTGKKNMGLRESIKPGQGAGNEVIAYALDRALGGRYGIPRTRLVELKHASFGSSKSELGSVQEFLPGMQSFQECSERELESIPRPEFDRLNFKLISGGTDGHYGNFLYDAENKKLGLIDAGLDFVGEKDFQLMDVQYWTNLPQASRSMSLSEYAALKAINVEQTMEAVDHQVRQNAKKNPILQMKNDKMLALKMRLELAKIAGEEGLTQKQWFNVLATQKQGRLSPYVEIFNKHIKSKLTTRDWREDDQKIDWEQIRQELRLAAQREKR